MTQLHDTQMVERFNALFNAAHEADDCHQPLECDPRAVIELQTELRHLEAQASQLAGVVGERDARIARLEAALLRKIQHDSYCDDVVCAEPDSPNCLCRREFEAALAQSVNQSGVTHK